MIRRMLSAAGCLLCLLTLLAFPCLASDIAPSSSAGPAGTVCLTAVSGSAAEAATADASAEEAPLPPKYEPENVRRNIAVCAVISVAAVTAAAIVIRTRKGY